MLAQMGRTGLSPRWSPARLVRAVLFVAAALALTATLAPGSAPARRPTSQRGQLEGTAFRCGSRSTFTTPHGAAGHEQVVCEWRDFNSCQAFSAWYNPWVQQKKPLALTRPHVGAPLRTFATYPPFFPGLSIRWSIYVDYTGSIITMPQWQWPAITDPQREAISRLLDVLWGHEQGHVSLARAAMADTGGVFYIVREAGGPPTAGAAARRAVDSYLGELDWLELSNIGHPDQPQGYDGATDNGLNQRHPHPPDFTWFRVEGLGGGFAGGPPEAENLGPWKIPFPTGPDAPGLPKDLC
jgi:hypothetical protein